MPNVLVVDDNKRWLKIATEFFGLAGWEAYGAPGGEDAIRKLTPKTDAVVLDLWMGSRKTAGVETLAEIRRRPLDHVCVVMLTAHGGVSSAVETLRHGAFQYLEKPADLDVLEHVLRGGIARQKASALRRQILGTLRVDTVRGQIEAILKNTFDADYTDFVVFGPDGAMGAGGSGDDLITRPFAGLTIKSGKPMLVSTRLETAELLPVLPDACSLLAAPIFGEAGPIGLLWMESRKDNAFDRSWQDVLMELGQLASIGVYIANRAQQKGQGVLTDKLQLLVRDLGHQILTPVQVIQQQIETLRAKELAGPISEPALSGIIKRLDVIERKTKSIVSVCEHFADISDDVTLRKTATDLGALLEARIDDDRAECADREIRLDFQPPSGPLCAEVDPAAILSPMPRPQLHRSH